MLIGLNPSTANEDNDDPTIRRIISLAKYNGYGGIYMLNLFPFITPYPSELKIDFESRLDDNDYWLRTIKCANVVFCWGNFNVLGRDKIIQLMFPQALCFGKNKNGSPKHPLYLPAITTLIPFK